MPMASLEIYNLFAKHKASGCVALTHDNQFNTVSRIY